MAARVAARFLPSADPPPNDDELTRTSTRTHDSERDLQAASDKLGRHLFEARICLTVATPKEGPLAGFIQKNFPKVNVLTDVKSYEETLQAVLNGKADAAALNTQAGAVLARELFPGQFSLPDKGFLETPIGVGVMKSKHGDFLKKLNEGLKAILTDGTYDRILAKWGVGGATKPRIP